MIKIKKYFSKWSLISAGLLFVGILIWIFVINRIFPVIPDNFVYRSDILSFDNFFDESKNDFTGEIFSKTRYYYLVEKKENNILTMRHVFDVHKPSGEPIFSVERRYGIDQITGKHAFGYGDKNRDGYLFAPKNPGNEYTYWHINYDAPAQMKLIGEEEIEGLLVYQYESNYKADQTLNLSHLPGVPKQRGVELDINLQLWVEPTNGYLIKYTDQTTAWYYDIKTKKRIHPWNRFHNEFEETSISKHVQIALLAKERSKLLHQHIPIVFTIIIMIILLTGYTSHPKNS